MNKNKDVKMKTTRATKTATIKAQQPKRVWYKKHILAIGIGLFLIVTLGTALWIWYGQWADRENMMKIEKNLQTLQEREKTALKDAVFNETKECVQPVDGWLGRGQLFCTVTEFTLSPVDSVEDLKNKIDVHYQAIETSTDIIRADQLAEAKEVLYPDLSNGLSIADSQSYIGTAGGSGINLVDTKTRACAVTYTVLNSKAAEPYAGTLKSASGYFFQADIRCSADTMKGYYEAGH